MLVDTGASQTSLDSGLLLSLGYEPSLGGATVVNTAAGPVNAPSASVRAIVLGPYLRAPISVLSLQLPNQISGLLGADFLIDLILVVNYRAGYFELLQPGSDRAP